MEQCGNVVGYLDEHTDVSPVQETQVFELEHKGSVFNKQSLFVAHPPQVLLGEHTDVAPEQCELLIHSTHSPELEHCSKVPEYLVPQTLGVEVHTVQVFEAEHNGSVASGQSVSATHATQVPVLNLQTGVAPEQ